MHFDIKQQELLQKRPYLLLLFKKDNCLEEYIIYFSISNEEQSSTRRKALAVVQETHKLQISCINQVYGQWLIKPLNKAHLLAAYVSSYLIFSLWSFVAEAPTSCCLLLFPALE